MYKKFIKHIIDLFVSLAVLIVLMPLFLIITVFLLFANNGKPFYFQQRPGKNEKIFTLVKFKTMNDKVDENGKLLPPAKRITKVGKFIRSLSLDELPQLINVIKGDMSLVGPRPLLIEYLPLYNEFQKQRHKVKPGITGWAQVNGRNAISWEEKFKFDVYYVNNLSFLLDIMIILLTIKKVFKREDINKSNNETMEKFKGNK